MSSISSPLRLAIAAAALSVFAATACSHEEKKEPARPVAQPAPTPPAPKPAAKPTEEVAEAPKAKEEPAVFFDFDSSLIKDDGRRVLQDIADNVRKQNASLEIAGNCDELGTTEYNLALGEARARAAKEYLVHLGVSSKKIATVSYGSQRPKYPGHDDDAHAKNRRDDLVVR
ncbi:MAG TPA: OmpA family protein [Polyangia bacterium]|jgi:peptidoglycan-associated lipoprotein